MGLGRCGEGVGLGLRIRIGEIVAKGRAGRKEPVHGPPLMPLLLQPDVVKIRLVYVAG